MPGKIVLMTGVATAVLLAGCAPRDDGANTGSPAATPTADTVAAMPTPGSTPTPTPTPSAPPAQAVDRKDDTGLLKYDYAYPAAAAAIPGVRAALDQRAVAAKTAATSDARKDKAGAAKSGYPFHAHEYSADWTVAADTPRFLSLVGEIYTYTGGAHGMTTYRTLLWDKEAGRSVPVDALFTGDQALDAAIRTPFCAKLDAARAKKRGAPVTKDDQPFDTCIDPVKETLVPASAGGKGIDRLAVYIAPYDAGPYAEGSYRVTLDVDSAMLRTVRPAYRGAFATD